MLPRRASLLDATKQIVLVYKVYDIVTDIIGTVSTIREEHLDTEHWISSAIEAVADCGQLNLEHVARNQKEQKRMPVST